MQGETLPLAFAQNDAQASGTTTAIVQEKGEMTVFDPTIWVDRHGDALFRYAMMRLRDESLAEDIVQETLLAAIQSLKSFSGNCSERTWLTSILKHKIIDYFRKNSKQVQLTDEDTDLSGLDKFFEREDEWTNHWNPKLKPVEWNETPEQVLERTEFRAVLHGCLSKLPVRIANVFTLREMDGLTSEEICEILNLSSSNFWVIMHRARMQLRACIEFKWFRKIH
jgi:RNA polymerase sigma-70 factor (TIGR02943 family)